MTFSYSYPLIIYLENHCTLPMQKIVARLLRDTFGDTLYTVPIETSDINNSTRHDGGDDLRLKSPSVSSTSSDEQELINSDVSTDGGGATINKQSPIVGGGAIVNNGTGNCSIKCSDEHSLDYIWRHLSPAQLQNKIIIMV